MSNTVTVFLMQQAGQFPVLLTYLVGIVLALVFWRRCPLPSALTLVAMTALLLITFVQAAISYYIIHARADLGWNSQTFNMLMTANALVGSLVRALAFGLLLSAVFVGRKPAS